MDLDILLEKLKEVLMSVVPVVAVVLLLNFTLTPLGGEMLARLLIGALFIIVGLTIFLFGVDIGITPIGNQMGKTIARSGSLRLLILAGLGLGFFISAAEPDLHILAGQVASVTAGAIPKTFLVLLVSAGIAILLTTGFLRIVYNRSLNRLLAVLYGLIGLLALVAPPEFLAISFDSSGATTGALAVPFILSLAMGVSSLKRGRASEEDSFGLVGVTSTGAILAVLLMSILRPGAQLTGSLPGGHGVSGGILLPFARLLPVMSFEVLLALAPIVAVFAGFQKFFFHLPARSVRRIIKGLIYSFSGMVLFLTGVNAGFMEAGTRVGSLLAGRYPPAVLVITGFVIGLVVILAEPAVHVLTRQVEDATSGYIRRKVVLVTLSIGVSLAVGLSMLRIVIPSLQLWHFLLPGYLLATWLSFRVPQLFVGIAYDSGGVASGPMTATFVLAFSHGAAGTMTGASLLADGFGLIAMVAMTPILSLQILGILYQKLSAKGGLSSND